VNSQPGPARTLELPETLRVAVRELTARANKLGDDLRVRLNRERIRRETALGDEAKRAAEVLGQAEAECRAARAALETAVERRKARVSRAYQSCKEGGIQRVEDGVGARKYEMQKRMLQAERDRDAGLAAAAAWREELNGALAAEQASLTALEAAAQAAYYGYNEFRKEFAHAYETVKVEPGKDAEETLAKLRELAEKAGAELLVLGRQPLPKLGRYWGIWVLLALCAIPLAPVMVYFGHPAYNLPVGCGVAAAIAAASVILRLLARRGMAPHATAISGGLAKARTLLNRCQEQVESRCQRDQEQARADFRATTEAIEQELRRALAKAGEGRVTIRMRSDEKAVRANARLERLSHSRRERLDREQPLLLQRLRDETTARRHAIIQQSEARDAEINAGYDAELRTIAQEWTGRLTPVYQSVAALNDASAALYPPWTDPVWTHWSPPARFAGSVQFARAEVDVAKLCEGLPKEPRLALPGAARFPLTLSLAIPDAGSLLIETGEDGHDEAIGALNNIILRLLATSPPGRSNFSIIDPVGLGQNFAGVMHLADYEEQIINSRIWTQPGQIEQRLAALNEHLEKVIQMYLRNEYATIADYNEEAGVIAEKYYFVVVADFPAGFTEASAKRLLSIAASGARCGVHMLIHWDRRLPLPQDFIPDDLRKSCFGVVCKNQRFQFAASQLPGIELFIDAPPAPELAIGLINQIGKRSKDSSRVEVPFSHIAPTEAEMWSGNTTSEMRVAIGRTGATKLQYLAIGKGTCQHGLIAGKTGSGKSTLFHVIISNLALWCPPDQVEFYLVDFKKGVEFKCYASNRLPHARVVAIESDREFGLSVLQRLDDELKRRGDLFRSLGVQDIPGYKRAGGKEAIPRSLLMIDEFQEFFVEDDKIAQTASLLLDRIVRQGRAFGIHVLLGSQTLGGAYTVARTTLGQMVIRIALQCNEADAYLIMEDNNPAPRLLSRPGEGIYNDAAGALAGNSPFQVVWLPDEVRDGYLKRVRARADLLPIPHPGPIVFEGNAPADPAENPVLRALLSASEITTPAAPRIWLGAPNSIKGPTEAIFHRQSGSNLIFVGQREEAVLASFGLALLALAAQFRTGGAQIIFCDATPAGTPQRAFLDQVLQAIPFPVRQARPGDLQEVMAGLSAAFKQRSESADPDAEPPAFLLIHGLHKFNRLRHEDDFSFSSGDSDAPVNPGAVLNTLLTEGTRLGFHVIASCDTYNNVNRFLSRKGLSEFEMRVLFQMNANDSASLIDSPKASNLGLHRALFFNQQEGHLETYRPYALPAAAWIAAAGADLARLAAPSPPA